MKELPSTTCSLVKNTPFVCIFCVELLLHFILSAALRGHGFTAFAVVAFADLVRANNLVDFVGNTLLVTRTAPDDKAKDSRCAPNKLMTSPFAL